MVRALTPICAFAQVLVENQGRYVLAQEAMPESGNPWCIPAGGVEPGESIIEAARRETLEETGLVVEPRYLMRIEHLISNGQDKLSPRPELWFFAVVADFMGGKLKTISDEHSLQAQWFHPDDLDNLNIRAPIVLELIGMHRRGTPLLSLDAYVSREDEIFLE